VTVSYYFAICVFSSLLGPDTSELENYFTQQKNSKVSSLLICCVRDFCVAGALCIFARDIFARNNSKKISTKFANGFENNFHKV
jgi:hypothetical protein